MQFITELSSSGLTRTILRIRNSAQMQAARTLIVYHAPIGVDLTQAHAHIAAGLCALGMGRSRVLPREP